MVEGRGLGALRQVGQVAHHLVEGRRRVVVFVDRGIEEVLAGAAELVLAAERFEEAGGGAEIGYCGGTGSVQHEKEKRIEKY